MTRLLVAGAVALGMMTGVAAAQSTSSETSITTAPVLVAPMPGALSTTTTRKAVGVDGTQTNSTSTSYGTSNGVASDTVTKTTNYPPPATVTTTRNTSTTTTQ
jgi:hypothetical protein